MTNASAQELRALVLAAGAAKRFGSAKQLAQLGGRTLLSQAVENAQSAAGSAFHVVLGSRARQIASSLGLPAAHVLFNAHWREGIASSIRAGIEVLPPGCAAVLLLLADQPLVSETSLTPLIAAWRRAPTMIIASHFGDTEGAPCIFPRWSFGDLLTIRGAEGAQKLLRRHTARVQTVPHPEAGLDIDTPGQLAALEV
jgi:molybdenum cofactor cytidylyltransferase